MCNESSVVFFVLTSRVWSENIFGFDANKTVLRIGARKVHHFVDAVWKLHFVFTVLKKKRKSERVQEVCLGYFGKIVARILS